MTRLDQRIQKCVVCETEKSNRYYEVQMPVTQ